MRQVRKENKRERHTPPSSSFWERMISQFKGATWKDYIIPFTGIILLMVSLYLFIAYGSYLVRGDIDQSYILNPSAQAEHEITPQHESGAPTLQEATQKESEASKTSGKKGLSLIHLLVHGWIGLPFILLIAWSTLLGARLLRMYRGSFLKHSLLLWVTALWSSLLITAVAVWVGSESFFFPGGKFGVLAYRYLSQQFGIVGVALLLVVTLLVVLYITFTPIKNGYQNWVQRREEGRSIATDIPDEVPAPIVKSEEEALPTPLLVADTPEVVPPTTILRQGQSDESEELDIQVIDTRGHDEEVQLTAQEKARQLVAELGEYNPTLELYHYKMPPIDLLEQRSSDTATIDQEEIRLNKENIIQKLGNFGIGITSITATVGPTITLYEVKPDSNVKVAQIRNLEDDIAMSLSALGIRIIAPMPGKDTVGLEVPNKSPQIVGMRSVIASPKFQNTTFELPIALGRTITNEVFTIDLAKIPHLLIAGATGQGKSVALNAVITSLLYSKHPAELKFVMIDPKVVELSIYAAIEKHYIAKLPAERDCVITDTKRVINTLNALVQEMEDRYQLLSMAKVRNVIEYNEKIKKRQLLSAEGHHYLPYIVVIIDEFGDFIMTAGKEIELPIARIAQKARAVGIHAIIATQRPTTSIITGTIKANFPGRISFKVAQAIDSRIILDAAGANRLVGKGDLLFTQGNLLTRVQCAFIDTPEVTKIVDYISQQDGFPEAYPLPDFTGNSISSSGGVESSGRLNVEDRDILFEEVARVLVAEQQSSVSFIQRKFEVGYNRAGRIMEQFEAVGIVSAPDKNKARELLVQTEEHLEAILSNLR